MCYNQYSLTKTTSLPNIPNVAIESNKQETKPAFNNKHKSSANLVYTGNLSIFY